MPFGIRTLTAGSLMAPAGNIHYGSGWVEVRMEARRQQEFSVTVTFSCFPMFNSECCDKDKHFSETGVNELQRLRRYGGRLKNVDEKQ